MSWQPIPGFPGYEAHPLGQIRNAKTKRELTEKINGRWRRYIVQVRIGPPEARRSRTVNVARLVCLAFWPCDEPEKYEAGHINGDKTDDRAENLEWQPRSLNQRQRHAAKPQPRRPGGEWT